MNLEMSSAECQLVCLANLVWYTSCSPGTHLWIETHVYMLGVCQTFGGLISFNSVLAPHFHRDTRILKNTSSRNPWYYINVIMSAMASQISSPSIVYANVCSGADHRKHKNYASLSCVKGIQPWPVNSPHKGPVTRKMVPFDDIIMEKYGVYGPPTPTYLLIWKPGIVSPSSRQETEGTHHPPIGFPKKSQ